MKRIALIAAGLLVALLALGWALARRDMPEAITYGASFSKLHAEELGLDWRETYQAVLTDLRVRHLRLSAHWPMVEPEDGRFDFEALDYQMKEAEARGADVILAIGHRTPGWPECHTPTWVSGLSRKERQERVLSYMRAVVHRYKDAPNLRYFQVENEPYLHFAAAYCEELDEAFFERELALVRELAPAVEVLVTDSGEMGKWYKAWQKGDVFGTSVYLYVWYEPFGPVRYPIGPWFFRIKQNLAEALFGKKTAMLIELGLEPWLNKPIKDATREEQMARMGKDTFTEVIAFAKETGFSEQYLWGVEWWYYMREIHKDAYFWDAGKELFSMPQ
jgi:hypothetical protein